MAIRTPNPSINIPKIDAEKIPQPIQWHSLKCTLVTPMYGGGVISAVTDEDMPIRVTGIRGQLRFWWRLLAKQKWYNNLTPKQIRTKEFDLWGGMNDGDEDGKASLVLFRVKDVPNERVIENNLKDYDDRAYSDLKYILFPAYNETDESLTPHKLLNPSDNINWTLEFAFTDKINETQKNQVIETLQWWANFGGIGFRTRKGLGSVQITQSEDFPQIAQALTTNAVEECGCQLVQRNGVNNPMQALQTAIEKLNEFRQGYGVGRNYAEVIEKNGRKKKVPKLSYWSEPNAIRNITGTYLQLGEKNHKPADDVKNVFPRAMFGLPILFKFKNDEKDDNKQRIKYPDKPEPKLHGIYPNVGERLASPLILRAVYCSQSQQWKPSTLLLPYEHITKMNVILKDKQQEKINNESYPIWQEDTAQHIEPIKNNLPTEGEVNPLTAFLTYFAK